MQKIRVCEEMALILVLISEKSQNRLLLGEIKNASDLIKPQCGK